MASFHCKKEQGVCEGTGGVSEGTGGVSESASAVTAHSGERSSYLEPLVVDGEAGFSSSLVKMPLKERTKSVNRRILFSLYK